MSSNTNTSNNAGGSHVPKKPSMRNPLHSTKPEITIHLNSRRKIYSTMDKIEGTVTIKPVVDTEFDDVEIDFIGTSRTFVERYTTAAAISGRSEAYHNFLRLSQPKLDELYQEDRAERTLKAGKTYEYDFLFKVPVRLIDRICKHKVNNPSVKDAHYQLPPSLGDQELSSKDGTLDDMAPEMASVRYGIFVRVVKADGPGQKSTHVAAKARRIRVVPAVDEAPPLDVKGMLEDDIKTEYCVRKEKKLKKSLFLGNLGTLVMEAAQPKSARLPPANSELGHSEVNTTAIVMLRFEPAKGVKSPPRFDRLTSKLKSRTYYATSARHDFPKKADSEFDASRSVHGHTHDLISHAMGNFEWRVEDPSKRSDSPARRDSTVSIEEKRWIPGPSSTYTPGTAFWTARMPLPIRLPNKKHSFVPTFHSCLISRTYTLAISLSLQTAGLGGSIDLRVPMQISAAPPILSDIDIARRRESVASAQLNTDVEDDIRSFFAPRSLVNPDIQPEPYSAVPRSLSVVEQPLERTSTLDAPPPGYSDRQRGFRMDPLAPAVMTPTLPPIR
ncbi:hypothetical protein Q7P35_005643 [Cladosporium inversicolor]